MLNRISVSLLLKSVIGVLALAVIVSLGLAAWSSWTRLASINRIAAVANASAHMFTALHNLRVDRSSTSRDLTSERQFTVMNEQHRKVRAAEMPALNAAVEALRAVDVPNRDALVQDLSQRLQRLVPMQAESAAALLQPKSARRPALAKEYFDEADGILKFLEATSNQLLRSVKLSDPFVDQLLELKQLAWVARDAAGDAAVLVSNGLGGLPLPPDPMARYASLVTRVDTAWQGVEELAAGLPVPPRFTEAMDKAKQNYFSGGYAELRTKTLKALMAGEPTGMTVDTWLPMSVGKLSTLLGVAEAALESTKDYAADQHAAAMRQLSIELALLAAAVLLAAGMILVVTRRVTRPLHVIQEAMLQVANGDLTVEVGYADRKDEIGALAGAMRVFKDSRVEALRLRDERRDSEARAATERKAEMQRLADEFQAAVGNIVDAVSSASGELEVAAGTLTQTADTTQQLSGIVASASEDASANVQSVATATEEMTSSVNEIAVLGNPARSPARYVEQAKKTDARITQLSGRGRPHRRRRQADHRHRRADQPAFPQRRHRGGPRRRAARLRRGAGGEGARGADRQGHRRDRDADLEHAVRDPGLGRRHPGDQRHDRPHRRDRVRHRGGGRGAGRRHARDFPQRAAGRARNRPGRHQHHRRQPWRQRDRHGLVAGPRLGPLARARERQSQARGREIREDGARRLAGSDHLSTVMPGLVPGIHVFRPVHQAKT